MRYVYSYSHQAIAKRSELSENALKTAFTVASCQYQLLSYGTSSSTFQDEILRRRLSCSRLIEVAVINSVGGLYGASAVFEKNKICDFFGPTFNKLKNSQPKQLFLLHFRNARFLISQNWGDA